MNLEAGANSLERQRARAIWQGLKVLGILCVTGMRVKAGE
jgi:hypothetical protein